MTFENVLEELVGPIQDEFDRETPLIIRKGPGKFLVDAMCPVGDLVAECNLQLSDEITADTTGGLVIELLGHIPRAGERVRLGRHELTVLEAETTRVRKIEVLELDGTADSAGDVSTSDKDSSAVA